MDYPMWVVVIMNMGDVYSVVGPFSSQPEAVRWNAENGSPGTVRRMRPGKRT